VSTASLPPSRPTRASGALEAPCWPPGGRSGAAATAGDRSRPDGYGRWQEHGAEVDFFLEYDLATEPLDRLATKLVGYQELAAATDIATPVLFWLPTGGREATVRQVLAGAAGRGAVRFLVATANPAVGHGPAEAVWLPLDQTSPRHRLIDLADPDLSATHADPTADL
jgi:hypothetical protein